MNISSIRVFSAINDLGGRLWNPLIRWTQKHAVFVELETENGLKGLGECWCFDTAPDALVAFLRTEVAPGLVGKGAGQIRQHLNALTKRATLTARHGMLSSAVSGVDIALWDLLAQKSNVPLWKQINCLGSGKAELYASGGLYGAGKTNQDLCDELHGYVRAGFHTLKMKVGSLSIEDDAKRVALVRQVIGTDTQLIVDGVYSFTEKSAHEFFDQIRALDIFAFQSPLPVSELANMRSLCKDGIPVMAAEAEYRQEMFAELLEGRAVKILQVAPIACGGMTQVLALADRVAKASTTLSPEVSSTAVATMVACHIAAAHSSVKPVEYHMVHQLFFDRLPFTLAEMTASTISLPDTPGLGISLPYDRVKEELCLTAAER